jgi:hypothetical protein
MHLIPFTDSPFHEPSLYLTYAFGRKFLVIVINFHVQFTTSYLNHMDLGRLIVATLCIMDKQRMIFFVTIYLITLTSLVILSAHNNPQKIHFSIRVLIFGLQKNCLLVIIILWCVSNIFSNNKISTHIITHSHYL